MSARDFDEALADAANEGRYPTGWPRRPGDMTITHAHRTALRRVRDLGALGDLHHLRDGLRGMIEWVRGQWHLTDEGRALLAAHDALGETRRQERPRLESRPLPSGWRQEGNALRHDEYAMRIGYDQVVISVEHHLREQRALVALLEWVEHERAVRAQEAAR